MQPTSAIIAKAVEDYGALANNNELVESLRSALYSGERAKNMVPGLVEEVIEDGAWADRRDQNGRRFTFDRKAFAEFIEAPEPRGLSTTKDAMRRYLGDSSNPLRVRFEALAEEGQGGLQHITREPRGRFTIHNPNTIRVVDETIPFPCQDQSEHHPTKQDRSNEPQAGTSVGYAVRRLERESAKDPHGLAAVAYGRLKTGEISARRRRPQPTPPASPPWPGTPRRSRPGW